MFRLGLLSIIRNLVVHTAIGVCHTVYASQVRTLLAETQHN